MYHFLNEIYLLFKRLIRYLYKDNPDLPFWVYAPLNFQIGSELSLKKDRKFFLVSQKLVLEDRIALSLREMWAIYHWVKKTSSIPGDLAEVGVYKGGSAKLICEAKGSRKLHLFDTFETVSHTEADEMKQGKVMWSLDNIKALLAGYPEIYYYQGLFPGTTAALKDSDIKFSFVHLDADFYEPILGGLRFFYPRMSKGGVIIVHDYHMDDLPGTTRAVDEFFADKPETVIDSYETQALIIKQ